MIYLLKRGGIQQALEYAVYVLWVRLLSSVGGPGSFFNVWIRKHENCSIWLLALLVLTTSQDKSLKLEASVIMNEKSKGEGKLARSSLSTPSAADWGMAKS